uniref:hypothetical protein n=1 Tax=Arthrobacter sp. TaxID=1667 RepID=UPI00215D9BDC|nr:hypothetical protein [Arthrobacter sp.]
MNYLDLNFKKYEYELVHDWQKNDSKVLFMNKLKERVEQERTNLPILLSNGDLRKRWKMENRQSVHNVVKKNQFPEPVLIFSDGKFPLYLESEVLIYEINYPWVLTPESRKRYANWILQNVINP